MPPTTGNETFAAQLPRNRDARDKAGRCQPKRRQRSSDLPQMPTRPTDRDAAASSRSRSIKITSAKPGFFQPQAQSESQRQLMIHMPTLKSQLSRLNFQSRDHRFALKRNRQCVRQLKRALDLSYGYTQCNECPTKLAQPLAIFFRPPKRIKSQPW